MTLVCIFFAQVLFCVGVFSWTSKRLKEIELKNEKQKAEYYGFLYQFHKQMTDEDQQMNQLYAKQGNYVTPAPNTSKTEWVNDKYIYDNR